MKKLSMFLAATTVAAGLTAQAQDQQQIELPPELLAQLQAQMSQPIDIAVIEALLPEVVGTINGKEISKQVVIEKIASVPDIMIQLGQVQEDQLPAIMKQLTQEFLVEQMLSDAIVDGGYMLTEEQATAIFNEKLAELDPSQVEQIKAHLTADGKTLEGYIAEMASNETARLTMSFENFFKKLLADNNIGSDEEVLKFYNDNIDKFAIADTALSASHILIAVDKSASAEDKAAAKAEAEAVIERLKAGEDFAAVAAEVSACPSSARGGDLGSFEASQMVPEFSEAVIMAEPDTLIETPVETQFGYHVIRRNATESKMAFEDVKADIKSMQEQTFITKYVSDLAETSIVNLVEVPEVEVPAI